MSAILSFLGGSAFRAVWGEVASYFTKRQEAKLEITRMTLQGTLDAAKHDRDMQSIKLQADLGVQTIRVQSDADQAKLDGEAFREAMIRAAVPTGIKWVDAWNGCIRPAFGTLALYVVLLLCWSADWDATKLQIVGVTDVIFSIIGFYFADRTLKKAGK